MVIRTVKRSYRVIRTLEGGRDIRAFLCVHEGEEKGSTYLLMRPVGQELNKIMLLYFMEQKKEGAGRLFDCFVREGVVWTAFEYYGGTPLMERLKEECPSALRLAFGRGLAEQIFTQELPVYLQYEALNPSNLMVSKEHGLRADFLMFEPERISGGRFCEVQKRLADCFAQLFAQELKDERAEELSDFLSRLYQAEFTNGTDIYRAYRRVNDALLKVSEKEGRRKGLLTRLWIKAAGGAKRFFLFLYWLLVMALWGVFVCACVMPKQAPQERTLFRSIGELVLDGYAPSFHPPEKTEEAAPQEPEQKEEPEEPTEETELPAETKKQEPEMG